jgi:F-type H+-transporting ATPase subunit b
MKRFSLLLMMVMSAAIAIWTTPVRAAEESSHNAPVVEHPTAEHAGAAHGEEANLPPTAQQGAITAITTLIVFLALVVVLGKFAWGPISKGLQEREDKIRNDIKNAEESRIKAEATMKQYQQQLASAEAQVRELLNKAQHEAEKISTNVKMKAQQDAEEIKEKATKDIDVAKNAAVREVYETAATLSTSIAEKIIKRSLSAEDQSDLVAAGIEQFQSASKN